MNTGDLKKQLEAHGVLESAYCLLGICGSDRYCLVHQGPYWSVFFFERGDRMDERSFDTEESACSFFLDWVLTDESVRLRSSPAAP